MRIEATPTPLFQKHTCIHALIAVQNSCAGKRRPLRITMTEGVTGNAWTLSPTLHARRVNQGHDDGFDENDSLVKKDYGDSSQ